MERKRVAIIGYGHIGRYLVSALLNHPSLEISFVWNRTVNSMKNRVPAHLILSSLEDFASRKTDIIIEVAHPCITEQYGEKFLQESDYVIGSPTALANTNVENALLAASHKSGRGIYIPSGALWGGHDIQKMADCGALWGLTVTMKKHPSCLRLQGALKERCSAPSTSTSNSPETIYDGPVRSLCALAPNNVNTMAVAALAAHTLGFDGVKGKLVADPSLTDYHIVEVEAFGPQSDGKQFSVYVERKNPASVTAVTGQQTLTAMLASLMRAGGRGPGLHLC